MQRIDDVKKDWDERLALGGYLALAGHLRLFVKLAQ